jgi:mono/diheme cytochrome c family protein
MAALRAAAAGKEEAAISKLPPAAERMVDFAKDIRPIFEQHCLKCHGPEKQKSGYRVDVRESALKGGDEHAPNIIPGKSAESPLIQFVAGLDEDMIMPQKGERLSAEQIGLLRAWIEQGANWPADSQAADPRKNHWAFQALRRPELPGEKGGGTSPSTGSGSRERDNIQHPTPNIQLPGGLATGNPIDAFIVAKLAEKKLSISPEAERRTLIRRVSFDLIGLPPSPEEVEAFVHDPDPRAYEKLVDRLLNSPRYGECWARHWLDVVRFAESAGYEMNRARPNAWPYRDYVIHAFNDDVPYDRFVREQLAGDALGVDAATGFLVGGPNDMVKSPDPVLTAQQRADELHDMVSTTGSTFLGLTLGCARCHNHKFDPISQADYYAVTAVFQGVLHRERPLRPADYAERLKKGEMLRAELAPLDAKLAHFRPLAQPWRVLLLDYGAPPSAGPGQPGITQIEQPINGQAAAYAEGDERGQSNDRGDIVRLPNPSEGFRYWQVKKDAHENLISWDPKLAGRYRIWLSWATYTTYVTDAQYLLDRDGDLNTTEDQVEIARVNQRTFADGAPGVPNQRRWSGFYDAGVYDLKPESRVVMRSGDAVALIGTDAVLFEEVAPEASSTVRPFAPHVRPPVTHRANEELFPPVEAKYVRFTIQATSSAEPCIDELEVFTAEKKPRNVALAVAGGKAAASGVYVDGKNAKHQLAHINDGIYGNSNGWISNETGGGWVQVEFARPERINRVVWSRDRGNEKKVYDDRLPTDYRIEVSLDGQSWQMVASSADRLPAELRKRITAIPTLSNVQKEQLPEVARLMAQRKKLDEQIRGLTAFPPVYAGKFEQPGPTYRLYRGDPMQKKEEVGPAGLAEFGGTFGLAADAPEHERRLALANWIVDPKNPLTARVFVNRVWHYHFGTGIVDTPSDFGLNGGRPTHPELLDWLASEFLAGGWSVKALQRLIVTSATYRQASEAKAEGMKIDAGDRLLWRFPPRRLDAEALRDTMLAVSGKLDLRMGGPGFDLFEPNDNYVKVYTPKKEFGPAEFRRMVYQAKPRVQLDDVFGAFDCPDAGQIAPRRTSSTTPLQALNLLNSGFALQMAGAFAARLEEARGGKDEGGRMKDEGEMVRRAFLLAFGRTPTAEESEASVKLIQEHGLKVFCRALFNANEFINIF